MPGKYVTIVRDYSAEAELAYELTICNVSIFGEEFFIYPRSGSIFEQSYETKLDELISFPISHVWTSVSDY